MWHSCDTITTSATKFVKTMPATHPKTAHLATRVSPRVRAKFIAKATAYANHTEVLRELVEAFVEDRLTITQPVTPKENLYVPRSQD